MLLDVNKLVVIKNTKVLIENIEAFRFSARRGLRLLLTGHQLLIENRSIVTEECEMLHGRHADVIHLAIVSRIGIVAVIATITGKALLDSSHDILDSRSHNVGHAYRTFSSSVLLRTTAASGALGLNSTRL